MGISLTIRIIVIHDYALFRIQTNLFLGLTLAFNIVLVFLISARLVLARKAILLMRVHIKGLASQYITTINIVVESTAIWVMSAILYIACINSFLRSPHSHNLDGPPDFSALFPFFERLYGITSVICFFSETIAGIHIFTGSQSSSTLIPHCT
jgi:hypothetical protein